MIPVLLIGYVPNREPQPAFIPLPPELEPPKRWKPSGPIGRVLHRTECEACGAPFARVVRKDRPFPRACSDRCRGELISRAHAKREWPAWHPKTQGGA